MDSIIISSISQYNPLLATRYRVIAPDFPGFEDGTHDVHSIGPESYTLDQALLDRPGHKAIQLRLFGDYQSNFELYPKFHEYFRKSQLPLLVVWGENDTIFSNKAPWQSLKIFLTQRYIF